MAFNYQRSQNVATKLLTKYGTRAILRRQSGDRDCIVVETDFTPMERLGKLVNPTDRIFLISAKSLDPAPNAEKDILVTLQSDGVTEDEHLKFARPTGRLKPGDTVIYYEIQVSEVA
jgi:hypothetical protein